MFRRKGKGVNTIEAYILYTNNLHPESSDADWILLIYIYIYIYYHHHVALVARISLTLSCCSSLSSIASSRSSRLHPVSVQSCCRYVLVDRSTFACPFEGAHRRTSLMSSSLLFQQCPACLVRLTWMVLEMGCRWPYSCCFVGCCLEDLLNIARSVLVQIPSSLFSIRSFSVHVVHPYSSTDTNAAWKNCVL